MDQMSLNVFLEVSVSIFCVTATILMLILFVWAIKFRIQISRLLKKLDDILDIAKKTASEAKNFTERTIQLLETFKKSIFTFDFATRIVTNIIKLIKNNSPAGEKRS